MVGVAAECGSGRNGEFGCRIMEGGDVMDVWQVALAADRAEAGVDALLREVGVDVGDLGQLRIGEAEQLPTACEIGAAPAAAERALVANVMEARRQDMLEGAVYECRDG